jgi:hypothetical protein
MSYLAFGLNIQVDDPALLGPLQLEFATETYNSTQSPYKAAHYFVKIEKVIIALFTVTSTFIRTNLQSRTSKMCIHILSYIFTLLTACIFRHCTENSRLQTVLASVTSQKLGGSYKMLTSSSSQSINHSKTSSPSSSASITTSFNLEKNKTEI